jgi:hypothetical protein
VRRARSYARVCVRGRDEGAGGALDLNEVRPTGVVCVGLCAQARQLERSACSSPQAIQRKHLRHSPFSSMSICLIFLRLRILMATLWPVKMCSATFTCTNTNASKVSRSQWGYSCPQRQRLGPLKPPNLCRFTPQTTHLAKGADAQRLAQPVVRQEELG